MKHARSDYNGRVVDLLEPQIMAAVLAARMALTEAADRALKAEDVEAAERFNNVEKALAVLSVDSTANPIPADEPVFLIRGQDVTGAYIVRHWGQNNSLHGGSDELSQAAFVHATEMERWPFHKVADL